MLGEIPNRPSTTTFQEHDEDEALDAEAATNELEQLILGIHSAIDHLFSLAILIRRRRPKGRLPPPDSFTPQETSPDITYVSDKFPKSRTSPWLVRRIGNSITKRRQTLQYRQNHRQRLAVLSKGTGLGLDSASETVATTFQEQSVDFGAPQEQIRDRQSVFTSATSLVSGHGDDGVARHVPELSNMSLDGVQLQYGSPFECPYCRTIQNCENRSEWK